MLRKRFVLALALAFIGLNDASAQNAISPEDQYQWCEGDDAHWKTVRNFHYLRYSVSTQECSGIEVAERVVVLDPKTKKRLFVFTNNSVEYADVRRFGKDGPPLLVVLTQLSGTGHYSELHILSEKSGKLTEWTWPDFGHLGTELLRDREHLCCKDWTYRFTSHEVILARGIYDPKDPNCCPSKGGLVAHIKPDNGTFKVVSVKRVTAEELGRVTLPAPSK